MTSNVLFAILLGAPLLGFLFNGVRFDRVGGHGHVHGAGHGAAGHGGGNGHDAHADSSAAGGHAAAHHGANYLLAGSVATAMAAISFICSLVLVCRLFGAGATEHVEAHFYDWINVGALRVSTSFVIDHISAIMVLVVTGVGTLIHLFSVGYMSHDERPSKYFAYLNLFLFNMLLLILGDNLLLMFVGWEGVGLCSYLLIGFWFSDSEKAAAGMKAFITNRIGDAGFLLGIFTLFFLYGTVNFQEINALVPKLAEIGWGGPITLACLFLFVGATGKSAQIPLYVWLPDAMAGPTPVSALIHAATMVTAGVYMIVRLNPLFLAAPNAMHVIAIIGACTALMASTIGLAQWDIKKILAYSTVSQLGYMFLACGVGAFGAAMFHLMTHAFFKALMFLGSGSVIHAMDGEQDVRKMGGLKKYLPITYFTFTMGWLAIIGIPPFAGFFSKDEILWQSFSSPLGHKGLWVVGAITAACTAFYMTRLMALTFWGKSRVPASVHPHESPMAMTIPLIILGALSVVGGWIGIPHVIGEILPGHPGNWLEHWFEGVIMEPTQITELHHSAASEWALMGVSVSLAAIFALIAYNFYIVSPDRPTRFTSHIKGFYKLVANKYFVDEFYFGSIINPLVRMSQGLWAYVDVNFIDKTTYLISDAVKGLGSAARTMQNGNMQQYALYIAMGVAATIFLILR
jgi:NADH-quinone oxidoreductase subunit L